MIDTIFNDGVMEANSYPEGWLYLHWIQNAHGRLQKQLVKDLIWAENYIWKNHLKGWFTNSDKEHLDFQFLLSRIGAKFWYSDKETVTLGKWILREGDQYVWKRTQRPSITAVS